MTKNVESGPSADAAAAEFGRRVKALRNERGPTLEGLTVDSDLHWSAVGRIERGGANLTLLSILRIAALLDVDAGTLVEGLGLDGKG